MGEHVKKSIDGLDFEWVTAKGEFKFEGQDAVLFWITDAMKAFFDTIEEISGIEASNLVLEATGFRQGLLVGEYFQKMKGVNPSEAADMITNTYATAGWGRTLVHNLNMETKTLTIEMKDSWEHKINEAQKKTRGGSFLPAHFAGIFSGLLSENIWYNVEQFQLEGYDSTVVKYFPSNITITDNIHQLSRKKELEHIVELEEMVDAKTKELQELVKKLSTPIIPVLDGIVVVPLIGKYDEERVEDLIDKTLHNLPSYQANYLILDFTGLDAKFSEQTFTLIEKLGASASLIGVRTVLVGISAQISVHIAKLGISMSAFDCFQTLQHGIHYALADMGKKQLT
ncbi:STAS domain-containing protein [Aquibacillus kalidii]|uniref:STAS domain-containing protein n=1 Tax=Aquibacillus kalidii TaxID=2762597 RepID=UPI001649395C|nr:STAS domain-containing protein [Aquibacillus kalidii]